MKLIQPALRVMVLLGSILGFSGGWALIAHANKPVAADTAPAASAPADSSVPASLPPLDFNAPSQLQPIPQQSAPQFSMPRFRTRGS
ncbi:MAG: hypothetical protein M1482_02220 [Chloroflexi bacterium]|nr:hypothetical protein [Chloroflexota bacterium]